jgi:predicted SprT family Zn-dependent metalloprotease
MKEDLLKGISEELINKAKACKSSEEIFALAKEEGVELTEEQLEAVNGGYCKKTDKYQCPECGQHYCYIRDYNEYTKIIYLTCLNCDHLWMQQEPNWPE